MIPRTNFRSLVTGVAYIDREETSARITAQADSKAPARCREGTSVRITLARGGGEPFEVPIERCRFGPEDGAQVKREVDRCEPSVRI